MMNTDDYLQMSGIQHFAFCRRQWALAYLEQQWSENQRTAEGRLQHTRCHDVTLTEKRGDLLIARGMRVVSHRLKLTGDCDVVEFHKDPNGVSLQGRRGLCAELQTVGIVYLAAAMLIFHGHGLPQAAAALQ